MNVPRILLTAFEPFGGDPVNPSLLIARQLDGVTIAGGRVVAVELPCVFHRALTALDEALERTTPVLAVALGLAAGREGLSIERVAINVDDARIPDNAGAQPIDVPVIDGGPAAYFSTLPIKSMVAGLKAAGFPASVSQTAGTFVCNQVFYALQHMLAGQGVHSGFVHLPLLPEQAAHWKGPSLPSLPSWPVSLQVAAAEQALTLLVAHRRQGMSDLALSGGMLN
jgi:pyroglutamyl-peptidase